MTRYCGNNCIITPLSVAYDWWADAIFLHLGLRGVTMCRWCLEVVASAWHIAHKCCKLKEIRRTLKQTLKTITGAEAVLVRDVHCGFFFERCKYKDAQMANYISTLERAAIYKCFTATEKNTRTPAVYQNYFQREIKHRVLMEHTVHRSRNNLAQFKQFWFHKNIFCQVMDGRELELGALFKDVISNDGEEAALTADV
jgi:hypothetical protein